MTGLALAAGVLIGAVFLLVRARFWPYGPCPRCTGHRSQGHGGGGRGVGSTEKAYSRCGKCGGKRERVRPLARIYPKWREEARKGK